MDRKLLYRLKKYGLVLASLALFLYFSYHILTGNYGLFSWRSLEAELREHRDTLSALEEEEEKLQNKVKRLKADHLDRDLLDECARDMLNVGEKDEIVIIDDTP